MKKLISLVALLAMLSMCIMPVSASDATNEIYAQYSTEDPDALIISGTENGTLPGTAVTVSVFYSGKNYSNSVDGQIGQLASILVGETDAEGNWAVEFIPAESADYDIYAGTSHRDVLMKTVYVMADRSDVIDTIKTADKAGVAAVFADPAKLKGIIADMSILEGIEDTGSVGEILYGIREELTDVDEVLEYIDLACSMAVLKAKGSASSMETVLSKLTELGITLNNYNVYTENQTADISAAMAKRLALNVNNGIEGFKSAFTDALILGGVEGSATWADIAPFMELLNNSKYEANIYDVSVAVVGNDYETITDLEKAISSAVKSASKPGSSGGGGGGGGGSISTTNKDTDNMFGIIPEKELEEVTNPEKEEVAEKVLFTDVPESHWAFDGIHYLYWQGIVSGDDKGQFNPDNNITRAEMVKMLCNAFDIEPVNKASFADVSASDWFYGYAGAAYSAGLLKGADGNLNPNDLLTREDMAVLVYRFAQYAGAQLETSDVNFKDSAKISDYATEAIGALNAAGFVNGMGDGSYSPKGNSTRAQVATILYRFLTR